jgi:putative hydrolase of the HAD superfamily
MYSQRGQENFIDDFETGKITPEQFRLELRKKFKLAPTVTDQQLDDAWNILFVDLPPERLKLIQELRKRFEKSMLFSNTNETHYRKFSSMCPDAKEECPSAPLRTPVFTGCFDKEYYSFQLGMKKPSPEAFTEIMKREGLLAEETLFVDDSKQHIEGARKAGCQVIHLDLTKGMSIMMLPELMDVLERDLQAQEAMKKRPVRSHAMLPLEQKAVPPKAAASWYKCCLSWFCCKKEPEQPKVQEEVRSVAPQLRRVHQGDG